MTRHVAVIGLGGTIAMTQGPTGLRPARSVAETLAAVATPDGVETSLFDHMAVPSADLSFSDLAGLAARLERDILPAVDAAVVIQGTDTIEETAFALELMLGSAKPVVVTGAMRSPAQMGPDGPANLQAALRVAADAPPASGVLVVMNDEAHAARYVRKAHTTSPAAFSSADVGPLGRLHEGRLRTFCGPLAPLGRLEPRPDQAWPKVAMIPLGLDQDEALLRALPDLGYAGVVLAAMGAGHAPSRIVPTLETLADAVPVVLCSRAAAGAVCERTYGYPGSETDLLARGLTSGGGLSALKARILLTLCLAAGDGDVRETFSRVAALV